MRNYFGRWMGPIQAVPDPELNHSPPFPQGSHTLTGTANVSATSMALFHPFLLVLAHTPSPHAPYIHLTRPDARDQVHFPSEGERERERELN